MVSSISVTTDGWMPSVGSSRISSRGSVTSARAIASCWRCPPDSRPAAAAEQLAQRREQVERLVDQRRAALRARRRRAAGSPPSSSARTTAGPAARRPARGATRLCGGSPVTSSPSSSIRPGPRRQQPDRGPQQRGLARAVVPHHRGDPAGGHLDGDAVHHRGPPVAAPPRRAAAASDALLRARPRPRPASGARPEVDLLHPRVGLHLARPRPRPAPCPACSTVTDLANARMKSMSCSTMTTVRSSAMRCSSRPVSSFSSALIPATGSSSISSLASCTSSMPISSHCFWPCDSMPGGDVDEIGEADRLQRRGHLVGDPGPAAQQRQRAAAAPGRDVEVLQHA